MPGKDTYHVGKKILSNSNYHLNLGSDVFAASFKERILIGNCEFEDHEDGLFSKKSVVIPSTAYVNFVQCLQKAQQYLESNSELTFEKTLHWYCKVHHLVAQFGTSEGTTHFKILIKWNFVKEVLWNKLVSDRKWVPIDMSTLADKEFLYLCRGVYLSQTQTDVLYYSLEKLLECSFYEGPDSKPLVLDFVQFAMSNG